MLSLHFRLSRRSLRAHDIGRVILNMTTDQPWSHYFCCTVFGNSDFVRDNPVAVKRFLRAILKAADIRVAEPEWAARRLVDAGSQRDKTMRSRR